jgi:hypothetical protein
MDQKLMDPMEIAKYSPEASQWMQQVLSGGFLGSNPYLDQVIQAMQDDAMRAYQQSTVPMQRSELAMSGAYGTALGEQAQQQGAVDFSRGLAGQMSGVRSGAYESERDRMMQALGMFQDETMGTRGLLGQMRMGTESAQAGITQSQLAAAAQRAAANAAANASRYGSGLQYKLGMQGLQQDALRDLMNYSGQMNQWGTYGKKPKVGLPGGDPMLRAPGLPNQPIPFDSGGWGNLNAGKKKWNWDVDGIKGGW